MFCPRCKIEMKPGIALPERYEVGRVCTGFGRGHIVNAENLELIKCMKCPKCGHSDDAEN